MLNIRRVGALAALAAAGMAALYGWVRPPAESQPIAVSGPQGVTSPTGNPRPTPAEPVLAAPAGGQSRPPSSPAAALLTPAPAAPRNQRDEVDQSLRRYAASPDPRLLVQAARLSDGCQLVRATLRVSEPEAATEELAPPVAPGQRERTATLLAECADFAGQPVAAAQTEAWYLAAARAGNLEASARLLAQGKNPVAPAGAGVALDQLLAAGQPETFPDLGQALRVWTGNTVLEGKEVPVTVHEAAWHLAGCATTACPGRRFCWPTTARSVACVRPPTPLVISGWGAWLSTSWPKPLVWRVRYVRPLLVATTPHWASYQHTQNKTPVPTPSAQVHRTSVGRTETTAVPTRAAAE